MDIFLPIMDAGKYLYKKAKEIKTKAKNSIVWVFDEEKLIKKRKDEWEHDNDVSEYTPFNSNNHYQPPSYKSGIIAKNLWFDRKKEREHPEYRINFLKKRLENIEDETDTPTNEAAARTFYIGRLKDAIKDYKKWAEDELKIIKDENTKHEKNLLTKTNNLQENAEKNIRTKHNKKITDLDKEIDEYDEKRSKLKRRNIWKHLRWWIPTIIAKISKNRQTKKLSDKIYNKKRKIWDKQENAKAYRKFREKQKNRKDSIDDFLVTIETIETDFWLQT